MIDFLSRLDSARIVGSNQVVPPSRAGFELFYVSSNNIFGFARGHDELLACWPRLAALESAGTALEQKFLPIF